MGERQEQLLVGCDGTWQLDRLGLAGDTNIGRGLDLFRGRRLYVPGVGTGRVIDRLLGGAAGWKAKRRVNKVLDVILRDYLPLEPQWIGIEGYSRGAAMALELASRLEDWGIRVSWLGLYDPVHAMFGHWTKYVPGNVERWLALYAAHERRRTFYPTLLPKDARGRSVMLPGAHGDVGGQRGEPHCALLALHKMVAARVRAGADSAMAPHPIEPTEIVPSKALRLLPAKPRDHAAFARAGARTHRWVGKVAA